MPLTGLLTKYGFDGGWASVFYVFGKISQKSSNFSMRPFDFEIFDQARVPSTLKRFTL